MSTPADKKARLLAKAAKQTQKPITQTTLTATQQPHHQQAMQPAAAQSSAAADSQTMQPSARASPSPSPSPAAAPAALGYGSHAYSDDMDDMDATLYLDRDMDRMMSFLERAWKRLIEMANRVQKDVSGRI